MKSIARVLFALLIFLAWPHASSVAAEPDKATTELLQAEAGKWLCVLTQLAKIVESNSK